MCSAVMEDGRSVDIHEFCFQAAKLSDIDCVELQGGLFADCRNSIFRSGNVQIIGVQYCRRFDMMMFTNTVFSVRTVEICAVLSSNEVHLLKLKNRVFRQRNDQKCAVQS